MTKHPAEVYDSARQAGEVLAVTAEMVAAASAIIEDMAVVAPLTAISIAEEALRAALIRQSRGS